jgi:DDE superfamily endonuclease
VPPCLSRGTKVGRPKSCGLYQALQTGEALYISDPLPGRTHDAKAFVTTPVAEIVANSGGRHRRQKPSKGCEGVATTCKTPPGGELSMRDKKENKNISPLRAPVERLVAHFKSWRIFYSDYRRPYSTHRQAYKAGCGSFSFSITEDFE